MRIGGSIGASYMGASMGMGLGHWGGMMNAMAGAYGPNPAMAASAPLGGALDNPSCTSIMQSCLQNDVLMMQAQSGSGAQQSSNVTQMLMSAVAQLEAGSGTATA